MKNLFIFVLLLVSVRTLSFSQEQPKKNIEIINWKFKTGDSLVWASPSYNDSSWKTIKIGKNWESQGYLDYNGYGWYRTSFMLPSNIKEGALTDSLLFELGKISNCDQVYLNGKLLGENAKTVLSANITPSKDFPKSSGLSHAKRNYCIPVNDSRLLWNQNNVLTIRVLNFEGGGGMYSLLPAIRTKELKDYLVFDIDKEPVNKGNGGMQSKTIVLSNFMSPHKITGKLDLKIIDQYSDKIVATKNWNVDLKNRISEYTIEFKANDMYSTRGIYTFTEDKTGVQVILEEKLPYILTPKTAKAPRINGAKIVGVRPGHPFLFRIPVTGIRPMRYSVENLPKGLSLDASKGIISGSLQTKGEYTVTLKAVNEKGEATKNLRIVVGDKIALTPQMGWNSWNCFATAINEENVKATADALVQSGLADHGWTYVNIDDGWEAPTRNANGQIQSNEKFCDMKALTDYIHNYGLKAGIYSSPGTITCGQYIGSYLYELSDAKTFADWGFDYLKYDWCSYGRIAKDHSVPELQKPFQVMRDALNQVNRDILYSLSPVQISNSWEWGASVGADSWRTNVDINDTWRTVSRNGFNQEAAAPYQKPGNWNDPDMLVVGWVGWSSNLRKTRLTPDEQYTHISLWSLLSAPLLIGCDLTRLDAFTLNLLTNDEVIAIDQDVLGKQALPVVNNESEVIMVKDLEDGSKAVGLFNLTENFKEITVTWDALKISGEQTVRDLWRQKDIGTFSNGFTKPVPPHGVMLVKISK